MRRVKIDSKGFGFNYWKKGLLVTKKVCGRRFGEKNQFGNSVEVFYAGDAY